MKVFIFNREKFIKDSLDWYNENLEMNKFFNIKIRPREEVIKELENTEWAKELDGELQIIG